MKRTWILISIGCAMLLAGAPEARAAGKLWAGGGIGLGFGDVQYADLSGFVGYNFSPRWSAGVRLTWRNRSDDRYARDVTTNDYGGSLFARYRVYRPFFVQGEYEHLSYEFVRFDLSTERDDFSSVLVGGGVAQPLGAHTTLFVTVLYNLSYDSGELRSPYDDPWIFRAGVGFYF